jgi:hypothetical protein
MGCRIDFGVREGVLRAEVSGKASRGHAEWVARRIAEQAAGAAVDSLLIDVRKLRDRIGSLRTLLASARRRVAVVDLSENDRYYVFSESAARSRGCELRRFDDSARALSWLRAARQ